MVQTQTIEEILTSVPFFYGMKRSHVHTIAACGNLARYLAGEFLMREGDLATSFFLIREGEIAIESYVPSFGPITISTVEKDGIVGHSWLFPPYRCSFDAHVKSPSNTIVLNGECLRRKAEEDHELGYQLMKRFAEIMVQRIRDTRLQMLDVYSRWRVPSGESNVEQQ